MLVRNENAYYCCVAQLCTTLPLPLPHLPALYLAGDSHSLSPSWREVSWLTPTLTPTLTPSPTPSPTLTLNPALTLNPTPTPTPTLHLTFNPIPIPGPNPSPGPNPNLNPNPDQVSWRGETHLIHPVLVTGLKAWHLRPGADFFPKVPR